MITKPLWMACVGAAIAGGVSAQQMFPLPATTTDTTSTESTAPFLAPMGVKQTLITDRKTLSVRGLPSSFSNWDMVAFDPTARYVFVPAEVGSGAGVFRYDTQSGAIATLMRGNESGTRTSDPKIWSATNDDFARIDPASWSPWGSIITGEETTGGRLFEITNPMASGNFSVKWRDNIPAVSHEGLRFDKDGALYFVDEDNSGSIYKFVPKNKGDLSVGQSFVLSVDAFANNKSAAPNESWSSTANRATTRTGFATWVPMTDADGKALTTANPFAFVTTTGGRTAADELRGTPYGRPEDVDFNYLASGNQALYFTATSENRVYSVELHDATRAIVRVFCDFDTINLATGKDVNPLQNDPYTSPGPDSSTIFNNPDNLAVDAYGNVYVIEDANPGDIWKCYDANKDGVAESVGLFVSLGVAGCEPTGLIQDPTNRGRMICCIQHPSSGNDALWAFDVCPFPGSGADLHLGIGINVPANGGAGEFVRGVETGDWVTFHVSSRSAYVGAPYALLLQFPSNTPRQFLPGIWMDLGQPMIVLAGGSQLNFPTVLSPFGASLTVQVPPGLTGLTVMSQAVSSARNVNGGLVSFSDAFETCFK
ncbi:MAG TPA: alkaline phosphatase PhoX [Acidimicrobiia bacterium]|nr:alkaline phosphatase PhoX [Acidimicrobiia bacterium]